MWVNPNHPNPPREPAPPEDDGTPLATIPRGDGREELRVVLKAFNDRPYVAIRLWERDQAGRFWPVKGKGLSVRLGECAAVVDALRRAGELARQQQPPPRDDGPRYVDRGRPPRQDWREARLPAVEQGGGAGFDEFGGSR